MDRISGDIREDRRPKVQDTWVTVCESLRRKDRECLQAFCMLFCYESPIHSTGALFVACFSGNKMKCSFIVIVHSASEHLLFGCV